MGRLTAEMKEEMSRDLAMRLAKYGAEVVKRTPLLPDSKEGRHVRDQLLRSGTAPGAHYGEARGAQSRKDFVHKLSLALKELRESIHWFRVAHLADYLSDTRLSEVITEGEELAAIFTASLQTARRNG